MQSLSRLARGLLPLFVVLVWLGVGGATGPYAGQLSEVSTNDQAAFLPQGAESTRVLEEQQKFQQAETTPAIVVWTADQGRVSGEQRDQAVRALASLNGTPGVVGGSGAVLPSDDDRALAGVVPLDPGLGDELPAVLERITAAAEQVPGMTARVGGPAAVQADLSEAFAGIDGVLLGVAVAAVLLILLLVYRSLLLPFVIIFGAVCALALASAIVYALADHDVVRVDGQVQGILFILVIGAATDYALLLSARFREELAHRDRLTAMVAALRRSWGAIVASAATVALGLLALLLSDLTNNRALGPVGAIGIGCALLSTLTFLPAALALLGRAAYWPSRPRPGGQNTFWRRIAALIGRGPRRVWAGTALVLAALAAFAPTLSVRATPITETFVNDPPSVVAQRALSEHFPAGFGNPAVVVAAADRTEEVVAAAQRTPGVATAAPLTRNGQPAPSAGSEPLVVDGRARIDVTLRDGADSDAAERTVRVLRERLHAIPGADALVGGYTAQRYDTQVTAERDQKVIMPVVLAVIAVILVVLLRALPIPLLLIVTVVVNFLATLGVAALVFKHLLGLGGTEPAIVLYGFVFLVALGVDYNIFLMSRVREETAAHGARRGVLRGLTTTGGVITSAGVVLAATFTALTVIPLTFMAQIAFIVAFGVLLDTLVVRSLLVPALVVDIGRRAWWPGRLSRDARPDEPPTDGRSVEEPAAGERPHAADAQAGGATDESAAGRSAMGSPGPEAGSATVAGERRTEGPAAEERPAPEGAGTGSAAGESSPAGRLENGRVVGSHLSGEHLAGEYLGSGRVVDAPVAGADLPGERPEGEPPAVPEAADERPEPTRAGNEPVTGPDLTGEPSQGGRPAGAHLADERLGAARTEGGFPEEGRARSEPSEEDRPASHTRPRGGWIRSTGAHTRTHHDDVHGTGRHRRR